MALLRVLALFVLLKRHGRFLPDSLWLRQVL